MHAHWNSETRTTGKCAYHIQGSYMRTKLAFNVYRWLKNTWNAILCIAKRFSICQFGHMLTWAKIPGLPVFLFFRKHFIRTFSASISRVHFSKENVFWQIHVITVSNGCNELASFLVLTGLYADIFYFHKLHSIHWNVEHSQGFTEIKQVMAQHPIIQGINALL